jgi:hypothetical protein
MALGQPVHVPTDTRAGTGARSSTDQDRPTTSVAQRLHAAQVSMNCSTALAKPSF